MKKLISLALLLLILSGCTSNTPAITEADTAANTSNTTTTTNNKTTTAPFATTTTAATTAEITEETVERQPETSLFISDESGETEPSESAIAETAESLIGIPFADGGTSPVEGFDNSGFIYYVLRENGYVNCPRQISEQVEWGENAPIGDIKRGDIVYFSAEPNGKASFGGVYVGGGEMIYSPSPGETVKRADISTNYWQLRFVTVLSL